MSICPCCGDKINGDLRVESCHACGAFAIGPPLAQPDRLLPSFGRALAIGGSGALLLLVLLCGTITALFEKQPLSFEFWNVMGAAETAAWRLKWLTFPLALFALWAGGRVCARIAADPLRFAGLRLARAGFAMSAIVAASIALLIGVTVPARLRQQELAARAAQNAVAYEVSRVLLEYQTQFGSIPRTAEDLSRLPDPDGAVARVAGVIDAGQYEPEAAIAALPNANTKTRGRRASAVKAQPASLRDNLAAVPEGLSFTNYRLVLPGADQKLGTADDITLRDGIIFPNAPPAPALNSRNSATAGNIATP